MKSYQLIALPKGDPGEIPFSLAYGTETIISPHIIVPSISIEMGINDQNSKQLNTNLDSLDE